MSLYDSGYIYVGAGTSGGGWDPERYQFKLVVDLISQDLVNAKSTIKVSRIFKNPNGWVAWDTRADSAAPRMNSVTISNGITLHTSPTYYINKAAANTEYTGTDTFELAHGSDGKLSITVNNALTKGSDTSYYMPENKTITSTTIALPDIAVNDKLYGKINSSWKKCDVYVKQSGIWKKVKKVYTKKNGSWVETSTR